MTTATVFLGDAVDGAVGVQHGRAAARGLRAAGAEPNACVLMTNHGYDPAIPGAGYTPFGADCVALMLRRAHAAYDAKCGAAA